MYFFETLLTLPPGTYPQACPAHQPNGSSAHLCRSLAHSHTHTHTGTHTGTLGTAARATSQSDPRLGSSWPRCWRTCHCSLHSLVTVTSQEAREHRCHRTSGAKYHPIPFGRLSPKTRTQSQTQTRGKASKREREPPRDSCSRRLAAACLLVTCLRSRLHTHPRRPELAFRASEPLLGSQSLNSRPHHRPSDLGQVPGPSPRASGWLVAVSRRCPKPGPLCLVKGS